MSDDREQQALEWQTGIWDLMSGIYVQEIERGFATVVEHVISRADLAQGQRVLDLGTGAGAVAAQAARIVGPAGEVVGVDISPGMLAQAERLMAFHDLENVVLLEGRAEAIPTEDASFDAVLASLSLMYAIDRPQSAREIARVLRPGGRLVAAVWAGPDECDLVRFQQIAGSFAPPPPVPGVGPGALGDPAPFLAQLDEAGIASTVESVELGFEVASFAVAWEAFANVTASRLPPERQQQAKDAVFTAIYPSGDGPRYFRNRTHFVVGERA